MFGASRARRHASTKGWSTLWRPTSCRAATGRIRIDRRPVDLGSALVPDAYPAAAIAQFGSRHAKLQRQFVSGRRGAGAALEQHSSGVQNDIEVENEIEEEASHALFTINNRRG
jgi:hypothetical protein